MSSEQERPVRAVVADGQDEVRSAIRLLLDEQPWLQVVGEGRESCELLALVSALRPAVVLLDCDLPGAPGGSRGDVPLDRLISDLRAMLPELRVIALSVRMEARRLAEEAGADAFVSKGDPARKLLTVLREVAGT